MILLQHRLPPNAGFWHPASACVRAVNEAVAALKAAGHHVEAWDPSKKGVLFGGEGEDAEVPLDLSEVRCVPLLALSICLSVMLQAAAAAAAATGGL